MTQLRFIKSYAEAGNISTFVFDPAGSTWIPGQYQTYVLPQAGDSEEENKRWFTIASAPAEGEVHITTRVSDSKFKQALIKLKPGDTIDATDIEGDFTWEDNGDVVLVAGGIGVTPYRSFFVERSRAGMPIPATLLYYGRDEKFAFRKLFDEIAAAAPGLKIKYLVGQPVTADSILAAAPQGSSQPVYLSGPEGMVENVGNELKERGVNVKQDWFPGYDEKTY
jgi:ferredoxin-NADP reductase